MTQNPQKNQPITVADFEMLYGECVIAIEELQRLSFPVTLNLALGMEKTFCPAPEETRTDENLRIKKLAGYVGAEALRPEHRYLLGE